MFTEYGPRPFGMGDLRRLESVLHLLDTKGVIFVVTYADCLEARRLLFRWKPRRVRIRRNIAGFTKKRRTCYELLATNSNCLREN